MTFIISAVTKNFAIQIADTRLTKLDGSLYDDKLVKTTIVHCYDAKLVISYTGIASIDKKRTDKWLVAKLRESKAPEKVFVEVIEILRKSLSEALTRNPSLRSYGLTLVACGLGNSPEGILQPAIALVSNSQEFDLVYRSFKDIKPKTKEFNKYFFDFDSNFSYFISVDGAVGKKITVAMNSFRRKIENKLRNSKSDDAKGIVDSLVAMLRLQAKNPDVGFLIGEDCTAVVINSDFRSSSYFYNQNQKTNRFPNLVRKEGTIEDLESRSL